MKRRAEETDRVARPDLVPVEAVRSVEREEREAVETEIEALARSIRRGDALRRAKRGENP